MQASSPVTSFVLGVHQVHHYGVVASTNDLAMAMALAGAPAGTVVLADAQTAGRGRRGRAWHSPAGAGLYASLVVDVQEHGAGAMAPATSLLTLAAGLALHDALRESTGVACEIKWPNDLVVRRKDGGFSRGPGWRKLAGILAEASTRPPAQLVVLGFGINLAHAAFPETLADQVTSIEQETGTRPDVSAVLDACLRQLAAARAELEAGRPDAILARWRAAAPSVSGSLVRWRGGPGVREGVTRGIDSTGALLIECEGAVQRILAGDLDWIRPAEKPCSSR
jgi:BirA family biotin operon repressor/biotin-[acetyl-CoA-carboxylase] ligase